MESVGNKPSLQTRFWGFPAEEDKGNLALREDDRLVGVGEDAVVEVPANGSGEDEALKVAAFLNEVRELVVL